jgi:hypothetical protein
MVSFQVAIIIIIIIRRPTIFSYSLLATRLPLHTLPSEK